MLFALTFFYPLLLIFFLTTSFVHLSVDSILCSEQDCFCMRSLTKGRRGFTKDFIVANIARMEFQPIFFFHLLNSSLLHGCILHRYRSCATLRCSCAVGTARQPTALIDLNICLLSLTLTPCHISLGLMHCILTVQG